MDREWREAADLRPSHVGLALALLAAALLRFWALGYGLPYSPGVDEPEIVVRAVRMIQTGDFNPHFFFYPSLYIYVQVIVAVARFIFGAIRGEFPTLGSATPVDFYLWGRAVTALFGVATVYLLHLAGLRWGARTALLSAALLAVMPLHVRESHFVLADVPVTFFVTLTFLLSLVAHERSTLGSFVAAGAAAGLATATKYNGVLALVLPLIACWMTPGVRPTRMRVSYAVLAASGVCFLVAVPYSVLDLPTFLDFFARLSSAYQHTTSMEQQLVTYLKHLRNAWHWPASLMIIGGLLLGLVRTLKGPGRIKWTLLIVFPALYLAFVSRQSLLYARYLLPILPFLALLGGAAVVSGVSLLRRYEIPRQVRSALIVALVLLAIAPPAYTSIGFDLMVSKVWTTKLAYDWIQHEIPKGSKILIETQELQITANYRVDHVPQLWRAPVESYAASGTDYIIASSQAYGPFVSNPQGYPEQYTAYSRLFQATREVARFTPSRVHPGPELRILRVDR
ncbi:MAG TPA: phospholipid carrier-dependent glycosyltransferase [Vicinamibacterales bacterium]